MNVRALVLGAALGFLVAIVPACGQPKCEGCVDASGRCVPASASSGDKTCGTGGATCVDCTASGKTCSATSFTCEVAATGGGAGGGATGGGAGGGTGGGATGGGAGGGATGGGTGGGATGGGTGGGTTACDLSTQNCPSGSSCMVYNQQGAAQCFAGECDLVTQNCAGANGCTYAQLPDGGVGRACMPAGTATEGQTCSQTVACGKGLLCLGGKCSRLCYTDANCTGGGQCIGGVTVPGSPEIPLTCVTLTSCDPLAQNCQAGEGCYLTQTGPACVTAGTVPAGQACSQTSGNCTPGNICLLPAGGGTTGTCNKLCNLDGGLPNCGTGTCGQLGGVPYGACP